MKIATPSLSPINSAISGLLSNHSSVLSRSPFEEALHFQKVDCVMAPIHHVLSQLETGYVDTDERGRAVSDVFGEVHEVGPPMLGWVEFARRVAPSVDTQSITRIAKRLIAGVMIEQGDISKARTAVQQVTSKLIAMTEEEIQSMCNTASIAICMQNAGLAERRVS